MKLPSYICDHWQEGSGTGVPVVDPVTGNELAHISSEGLGLSEALEFARCQGAPALWRLTYRERADGLAKMADVWLSRPRQRRSDPSRRQGSSP